MKRTLSVLALATLVGCTSSEIEAWVAWHETDPIAAVEFVKQLPAESNPQPGDCDSYVPLFEEYGLPVATFKRIAWRESGCNHNSFVRDSDDLGGGLLGINLRAGAARWNSWCGLTIGNVTNARKNVECAAAAYQRMGMQPWG